MIVTRQSQSYWAASERNVARQLRRLEIENHWNSFGTVAGDAPVHARCTWTVPGMYYRTIDNVHPADYETRETSFLPPAVFDLSLWRLATYSHQGTEVFKSGFESIFRNFYVVSWARPGDIIVGLGVCPNFFLLRQVIVGDRECFQYLGRAIAKIPTHMLDRSAQTLRDWYGQEREIVLI